jgi:ABC-type transport system involved in multi-copper enzyme maturation permease subunit
VNANALRALAADAYHQVVDNWVFRILAVLALLPILLTFTVGLRPDSIELLFGLKSWSYAELFAAFGAPTTPPDPRGALVEGLLEVVFDFLAGSLGMLLAISATAFFVPRMLEKGTADLYFHKPVSRTWLLLSRYFAGLVFIALLGTVLVGGMYLGLALVSGYHDPGILVAAPQLVYLFALVFPFAVLCGVVTRSTVASILLTGFFFLFNGCVHNSWIAWEQNEHGPGLDLGPDADGEGDDKNDDAGSEVDEEVEERGGVLAFVRATLDGLHLVLPKTTDAGAFASMARKGLARPHLREEDSLVTVFRLAEDFSAFAPDELAALAPPAVLGEARFGARSADGELQLTLWRRPSVRSETRFGERVRVREESSSRAAEALAEALEAAGSTELQRESTRFGTRTRGRDLAGSHVRWRDAGGASRSARVFKGTSDAWIYTLLAEARTLDAAGLEARAAPQLAQLGLDVAALEDWYPNQLGFTAPLRFNVLFSVGSSLAFVLVLLALAAWRLARISF